jgi:DNA repair protein RadC
MNINKPSHLGHRARIRKKFLNSSNSLLDYEILELLLFSAIPRKDTKEIAKNLLNEFGDITSIVNADISHLKEISGISDNVVAHFKIIKEIIIRGAKSKITKVNIIDNWHNMIQYCQNNIGHLQYERLHILFLNKKFHLISDKIYGEFETTNHVAIDHKYIIKMALNLSSSYVILCHNHPSGNLKPSKIDIISTKKLKEALENVAIKMLDHIIIGNNQYYSFKESLVI